jgi:hypothetical protein
VVPIAPNSSVNLRSLVSMGKITAPRGRLICSMLVRGARIVAGPFSCVIDSSGHVLTFDLTGLDQVADRGTRSRAVYRLLRAVLRVAGCVSAARFKFDLDVFAAIRRGSCRLARQAVHLART